MNIAVVGLLALTVVLGLLLTAQGERVRPPWGAVGLAVLLAVAGALAWAGGDAPTGLVEVAAVGAVLAAVAGGGPIATAVLRAADPAAVGVSGGPADPPAQRGGVWDGVLGRGGYAATRPPRAPGWGGGGPPVVGRVRFLPRRGPRRPELRL